MNVKINIHNFNSDVENRLAYIDKWGISNKIKQELEGLKKRKLLVH